MVALSAALYGGIIIEDALVQHGNFDDLHILRFDEMPQISVNILSSDRNPTGVGEVSGPPAVQAILNALYAPTRVRIRSLPIDPQGLVT